MNPIRMVYVAALLSPEIAFALDITTTDGLTYKDCKIGRVDQDALMVTHSVGMARISYDKLPKELQDQYFDPAKVEAYRKQIEEARLLASEKPGIFRFHHENILGTSLDLQVFASGEMQANAIDKTVLAEISRLQAILSAYEPGSEVSKVNSSDTAVVCSPELIEVLSAYETWQNKSKGSYNGHMGELIQLWKNAEKSGTVPDAATLQPVLERLSKPGWIIDREAKSVTRLPGQVLSIDSLGKGFIIGAVMEAAKAKAPTATGMLLNIGGDIQVAGEESPGVPWKIGIANPARSADNAAPLTQLILNNHSVSTSGGYERGFTIADKRYSHILNPLTGLPSEAVASATVIAGNNASANALATTLCVLDPKDGLALIKEIPGAECLIVSADGTQFRSDHFSSFEVPSAAAVAATNPDLTAAPTPGAEDASKWPDNHKVTIALSLKAPTKYKNMGPKVKNPRRNPYVAFWVTNTKNEIVRTITVWGDAPKHIHELSEWWGEIKKNAAWAAKVGRATRSPGQYKIEWDGLDDKNKPLPQGTYTIYFEVNREFGDHETQKVQIDCGKTPAQQKIPESSEADETEISYGPASS